MLMLDLGAGLKGASQAMKDRGWDVVSLDINPEFHCDITADLLTWAYIGDRPDLIWFSMPCLEFSRSSMPWIETSRSPDMSLVLKCLEIVDEVQPRFWVCENVRGSIPWFKPHLGNYRYHVGPFYLWGFFPMPGKVSTKGWRNKESLSGSLSSVRAKIPYSLSLSIAISIEQQMELTHARP